MKSLSKTIMAKEFLPNFLTRILTLLPILTRFAGGFGEDRFKEFHINRAIRKINALNYLEIGVRDGESFNSVQCPNKVGVDPAPIRFGENLKSGESFYKKESDKFFQEDADNLYQGKKIDVALVDGLHEFKQSLKDILNTEKYISSNGIIFVHDCNPPTRNHADVRDGGPWNGDVWKIAVYIKEYRRDLDFFTLDCDWGVGVITGFKGDNQYHPADNEIVNLIKDLDYCYLERNRQQLLQLKHKSYSRYYSKSDNHDA